MTQSTKRIISTIAIVIASVAFGVLISADFGLMQQSHAQSAPAIQTRQGAVTAVTIPSFADVASRVMPAVVAITTTEVVKSSAMRRGQSGGGVDPFEFFFPNPNGKRNTPRPNGSQQEGDDDDEHAQKSGGSGFFISPDGYLLTNNHVVEDATRVDVHFGADDDGDGGRTVRATIIGRDPATDIALLKIESSTPVPYIQLGNSDQIRKGDWAIAIGNPFQFENSLTVGVISAKGRSLGLSRTTSSFENFIQTDAAINFGNSGGPLMNINGEVIGINTAIRGGGAQGLGFATPINTAKLLLPQLRKGKVTRSYLGMQISSVTDQLQQAFNLASTRGAVVQSVETGKPAEKAGLQIGDVITRVDDHDVRSNRDLIDYISYRPIGSSIKITVLRNGEQRTLNAVTAERRLESEPDAEEVEKGSTAPTRNKLGISVQEITGEARQQYGIDKNLRGVLVTSVKEVSPAGEAGLAEGDVISEVQGQKISSVDQLRGLVDSFKSGQFIRIYVTTASRGGESISGYRVVQIP
jgi:serine protease Do